MLEKSVDMFQQADGADITHSLLIRCCDEMLYCSLQWMIQELNGFYLKAILWVPPDHDLILFRTIVYSFSGACAIHDMYHFLSTK